MLSSAAGKATDLRDKAASSGNSKRGIARRVWLPKLIYDALPYFYLASGIAAFLATLYISEWFWVLPHYLLFSAACVHLGIIIYRRRHRRRRDDPDPRP